MISEVWRTLKTILSLLIASKEMYMVPALLHSCKTAGLITLPM